MVKYLPRLDKNQILEKTIVVWHEKITSYSPNWSTFSDIFGFNKDQKEIHSGMVAPIFFNGNVGRLHG